jgi:hypothetical protein
MRDDRSMPPTYEAPLPVLAGEPNVINHSDFRTAPPAVRDAKTLTSVATVLYGMIGLLMLASLLSERRATPIEGILVPIFFLAIAIANGIQVHFHRTGNPTGWRIQIGLSTLALLGFPLLTLINGLLLAKWFRLETKAWYGL